MKILITGNGTAGSWAIRGDQLGRAVGATIKPRASFEDCSSADLVVVVKRVPGHVLAAIRLSGKPWVLDCVDWWPQPCDWDQERSVQWLQQTLTELKPSAIVYGTERMREDAGIDGLILPHHSWSKYVAHRPVVRDSISTLSYEGNINYLGRWHSALMEYCSDYGYRLDINGDMRNADIGIALRDDAGYPARWWKPGTKLSNLHALGIPALCTREAGSESVAGGSEFWIESKAELLSALDSLHDMELRETISTLMRASMIRIEDVAKKYLKWLEQVV